MCFCTSRVDASVGLELAENVFDAYPTLQTFRQVVNYLLARVSRRCNIASLCTYSVLYLGFVNECILSFCSDSTALLHCAVWLILYSIVDSDVVVSLSFFELYHFPSNWHDWLHFTGVPKAHNYIVNKLKPIKKVLPLCNSQCYAMGGLSAVALSRQNFKLVSIITCISLVCGNHYV